MFFPITEPDSRRTERRRRATPRPRRRGSPAPIGEGLEARCLLAIIPLPTIPNRTFVVTNFGAVGDGTKDNTTSIQAAINTATAAGGGTVEIPSAAAPYESGPLTLNSSINFQVDGGATLQMLKFGDYPLPNGATTYPDFISANRMHDVELSGSGTIDGQGAPWWTAFLNSTLSANRPQMVTFNSCTTVLVQDVTLTNPPNTHLRTENNTNNVTIQGITINTPVSPNTDGIDMTGTNQLVSNCNISDGDDNIALGANNATGSGPETANITITNCTFGIGHGLSIGSLTSGSVQNVTVDHVSFTNTTSGIRLKSARDRGGLVQNLSYSNITMTGVQFPINIASYYPSLPTDASADPAQAITATTPFWRNITISNLTAGYNGTVPSNSVAGIIWGLPEAPVGTVTLNNVNISAYRGMEVNHVRNLGFDGNSSIVVKTGTDLDSTTTKGLAYDVSKPYDATIVAAGFSDLDVGSSSVAGTSLYDPDTGNWSISGVGTGFGSIADQLNFASEGFNGAGTVAAKVNAQTNTGTGAEAGVMIRSSTAANAAFAAVVVSPGQGVLFVVRSSDGGAISTTRVGGITAPVWVKLIRTGSGVSADYSTDGTNDNPIGAAVAVNLPFSAQAGMVVASGNNTAANTASFSNVALAPVVTLNLAVARDPFSFDRRTHLLYQTVTITNTTGQAIDGPIALAFDNLANGTLVNATGTTFGASGGASVPAMLVLSSNGSLAAGASVSVILAFSAPSNVTIAYDVRVLGGVGLV